MHLPSLRRVFDALRRRSSSHFDAPSRRAFRDAGWVQILGADGLTLRGRGRLVLWRLPAANGAAYAARIESFAALGTVPTAGEIVIVSPEGGGERNSVAVGGGEPDQDSTILDIEWNGELPASLRELGGSHLSH